MNQYSGSNFDDFLEDEGLPEECTAEAVKRVLAMELMAAMRETGVSKAELARRLHTSRAQIERIINPEEVGVSLKTLFNAARQLGRRMEIRLA